jgi:hypothetical protein
MVGEYATTPGALVLRKPARLFTPLAWMIAGPLNPAGFFAHLPWNEWSWDMPFDATLWTISVAIPLSAGCAGALFYLRGGGFGFLSLLLVTALSTLAACALTGPIYTLAISGLREIGVYWTMFPVSDFGEALVTSGTFVRLGLLLMALPILPAAVLLRLVAFRREPRKKVAKPASTLSI